MRGKKRYLIRSSRAHSAGAIIKLKRICDEETKYPLLETKEEERKIFKDP